MLFSATYLHYFRSLLGQLTQITNKHQTKLTLKGGKARLASRLDSSLFEEGWEERALKEQTDIVNLTLRDYLGLSFQGRYIYLVIIIIIIIHFLFHLVSLSGDRNSEGCGHDTCPYIDSIYFTENSLKIISNFTEKDPPMLRVFRTQSQYSYYPQRFHLGLCEKKYLNKISQIPFCQCDLLRKGVTE